MMLDGSKATAPSRLGEMSSVETKMRHFRQLRVAKSPVMARPGLSPPLRRACHRFGFVTRRFQSSRHASRPQPALSVDQTRLPIGNDVLRTGRRSSCASAVGFGLSDASSTSTVQGFSRRGVLRTLPSSVSVRGGPSRATISISDPRDGPLHSTIASSGPLIEPSSSVRGPHRSRLLRRHVIPDPIKNRTRYERRRKTKPKNSVEKFLAHYKHLPFFAERTRSASLGQYNHHAAARSPIAARHFGKVSNVV